MLGEARKDALQVEYALENDLKSFGKGFTVLEKARPSPDQCRTWGTQDNIAQCPASVMGCCECAQRKQGSTVGRQVMTGGCTSD